ncbi:MAG: DUF3568 family protein [Verrucomicrobiota bacterium]
MAAFAGMALVIVAAGCVSTVSGTHTAAVPFVKDRVVGRYERTVDQVYQASVTVIQNNGVLITEYIPHDTTNTVRSLYGKVNERNVWICVEGVDPQITEVTVQARKSDGGGAIEVAHELEKEIALQLAR